MGGLIVHLGCGDGVLTASLHANDSYMVQGLDANTHNVERAREYVEGLGLYGAVSIDQLSDRRHLPYIDNLVNLIVVEHPANMPHSGNDACAVSGRRRLCEKRRDLAKNHQAVAG